MRAWRHQWSDSSLHPCWCFFALAHTANHQVSPVNFDLHKHYNEFFQKIHNELVENHVVLLPTQTDLCQPPIHWTKWTSLVRVKIEQTYSSWVTISIYFCLAIKLVRCTTWRLVDHGPGFNSCQEWIMISHGNFYLNLIPQGSSPIGFRFLFQGSIPLPIKESYPYLINKGQLEKIAVVLETDPFGCVEVLRETKELSKFWTMNMGELPRKC